MLVEKDGFMEDTKTGLFYDFKSKNKDFLSFAEYFKSNGIPDYYFHLRILDTDIPKAFRGEISIDECLLKSKIIAECQKNFWFYLREIMSITLDPADLLCIKRVFGKFTTSTFIKQRK